MPWAAVVSVHSEDALSTLQAEEGPDRSFFRAEIGSLSFFKYQREKNADSVCEEGKEEGGGIA